MEFNDFILLDQIYNKPLTVRIGKNTILKGKPGTTPDGKHLAIQITEEE